MTVNDFTAIVLFASGRRLGLAYSLPCIGLRHGIGVLVRLRSLFTRHLTLHYFAQDCRVYPISYSQIHQRSPDSVQLTLISTFAFNHVSSLTQALNLTHNTVLHTQHYEHFLYSKVSASLITATDMDPIASFQ